jgi:hypothetical protein
MAEVLESRAGPRISLLHATHRSGDTALRIRDEWLRRARTPDAVEHVFAYAEDDEVSAAAIPAAGGRFVVTPPSLGLVTAVRNWNAAAAAADGAILFVIADDLLPPPDWDVRLLDAVGPLDPAATEFAVKVADDRGARFHWTDYWRRNLLRHPVVSRAYYARFGLFDQRFRGVFCDDEITLRSFRRAVVVDGKSLVLDHKEHAADAPDSLLTESQARVNRKSEYDFGRETLKSIHPPWKPRPCYVCLPRAIVRSNSPLLMRLHRWTMVLCGIPVSAAVRLWRSVRPG